LKNILSQKNKLTKFLEITDSKIPNDIRIILVSNEEIDYSEKLSKKNLGRFYKNSERKKYLRSRYAIKILNLKDINYLSISHTQETSAIVFSDQYKVGVDIENINRKLSPRLIRKIKKNNTNLALKPIILWTMMESSYKARNSNNEHFTDYKFTKKNNLFCREYLSKEIMTANIEVKNMSMSISFLK